MEYNYRQRREMAMRTSDNRSSSTAPLFVSSPVASFSPRMAPKVIRVLQDADESEDEDEQQQQHRHAPLEEAKQSKEKTEMGRDASLVRTAVSTVSLSVPAPCALSRSLSSPALHASAVVDRAMNTGGGAQAKGGAGRRPTALSSPVSLCTDPSPPGPASPLVLAGARNLPGDASMITTGNWRSPRGTMTPYGLHFGPTRFTPTPGGPWLRSIAPLLRELQRVEIEDVPQLYDLTPLAGVRQVLLRRCANMTDDLSPLARARLVDIEACGRAPLDASGLADVQEVRLRGVSLRHAAALETVLRLELDNVTLHIDQGEADGQRQRQGERAAHGDNDGGWQEQAVWLAEAANDLAAEDGPGNDGARRCATSILAALLRQPMRGGTASGLTSGVATPSPRCGSGLSLRYHPDGTTSRYAHAPPELSGLRAVRSLSRSLHGPIKLIDGVAEVDVLASLPRAVALTAARDALAAMPSMVPGRPGSRGGLASGRASPLFAAVRLVPPPTPPSTPVHHFSPGSSPPGATSTSTAANRRWPLPSSLELAHVSSASADGLAPASRVVLRHWPRLRDVSALANVSRLVLFECHGLLDLEPLLQVEEIVLRCCSCIGALPLLQRGLARRAELDKCAGSALQDLAPLAGAAHVVLSRLPQLRDASALQHCQSVDVIACPQLQGAHLLPIGRRA